MYRYRSAMFSHCFPRTSTHRIRRVSSGTTVRYPAIRTRTAHELFMRNVRVIKWKLRWALRTGCPSSTLAIRLENVTILRKDRIATLRTSQLHITLKMREVSFENVRIRYRSAKLCRQSEFRMFRCAILEYIMLKIKIKYVWTNMAENLRFYAFL